MSGDARLAARAQDETPDVFVSYSRQDQRIVLRLVSALEAAGWEVWVDLEDIPPTADWSEELALGIRNAHTFVFVISPRSVRSEYCRRELDQAVALGKRLVPVVVEDTDPVPDALAARQYVELRDSDDFDASLRTLTAALATDLEWVREHHQLLTAALHWDEGGRDRSLLLRGRDLESAEAWLARQSERTEPRPTRLQAEFLLASRSWQTRRLQAVVAGVAVALAVAVLLGALALLQRDAARRAAAVARSRELAIASTSARAVDPELSLLLAIEAVEARPTAEADNSLRAALAATRLRAEIRMGGRGVRSLVSDVAFSPRGGLAAAALADGSVRLVDLAASRRARVVSLPLGSPSPGNVCTSFLRAQGRTRLAFSSDGRWLAAAGDRSLIQVWGLPHPQAPTSSGFCLGETGPPSPSVFASGALGGAGFGTVAVAFARERTIAAMEENGRLLLWDWTASVVPRVEHVSPEPIVAAALAGGDGRSVALADAGGLGSWAAGRHLSAPGRLRGAYAVAASGDGRRLAAARGRSIAVWSVGAARVETLAGPDVVRSLAMSHDGRRLAAGDQSGVVRVWSLDEPGPPVVLRGSNGPVTAVAFGPDGERILGGGDDGVLRVWQWESGTLAAGRPGLRPAALSRGRLVAVEEASPRRAWVEIGGRPRLLDDVGDPSSLSFAGDGLRAIAATGVAAGGTGAIRLWEPARSMRPSVIPVDRRADAVALSRDGGWIASGEAGRLRLLRWPGRDAAVLAGSRSGDPVDYNAAAFSPDGRLLAGAGYNGKTSSVTVWDLSRPEKPRRLLRLAAPGYVSALAFDSRSKRLLAAMGDGPVRVWKLDDGSLVVLRGHRGGANDAAFSPGGGEVISGGGDGTVRIWELGEAGKAVTIQGQVGAVTSVAFAPDGTSIEAVGTRGARRWSCDFCGPIANVLARARALATRSLSPDERALYLHRR